jgi:hypothetical protein
MDQRPVRRARMEARAWWSQLASHEELLQLIRFWSDPMPRTPGSAAILFPIIVAEAFTCTLYIRVVRGAGSCIGCIDRCDICRIADAKAAKDSDTRSFCFSIRQVGFDRCYPLQERRR